MFILGGYRLDENKRVFDSLRKIFGIGENKSKQIVCLLGLTKNSGWNEVSIEHKITLDKIIVHYSHGYPAKRFKDNRIKLLNENKSYRGVRHSYFLSVRGQCTHTNAKTQRNKKNKTKTKIKKKK